MHPLLSELRRFVDLVLVTMAMSMNHTHFMIVKYLSLAIQHLSAAGFGAKLLGVFGNGIVQSFIDARTLTPSELFRTRHQKIWEELFEEQN
ncbi:hypothetical protein RND71_039664 [Anisodus tanguticus]|uniref:Uncharacterized protein n=1 Tax=Anisodus tanguticus TaxID=243964 RepID=A0AAE1QXT6_9SOLA|nr:hypothetical protein RND71_039664 [Anisodus tanguticus]